MVLCLVLAVMAPMFAKTMSATGGEYKLDLSWIKTAVNLFVGLIGGGLTLVKTAIDIVHAVNNLAEDPNGIKKVIGRFVIVAIALGGFLFAINFVLGDAGGAAAADGAVAATTATGTENSSFYQALTGALVSL